MVHGGAVRPADLGRMAAGGGRFRRDGTRAELFKGGRGVIDEENTWHLIVRTVLGILLSIRAEMVLADIFFWGCFFLHKIS